MGHFVVWSRLALDALGNIYGNNGKAVPEDLMANADLARIINSDKVQSVLNSTKRANRKYLHKKNPLTSVKALAKLNPYAAAARESKHRVEELRKGKRAETLARKRGVAKSKRQYRAAGRAFYEKVSKQGDVCTDDFDLA